MPNEIDFPALKEVKGKIDNLRQKVAAVISEAGPAMDFGKVKSVQGNTFEIAKQVSDWNHELNDLGSKHDDLQETLKAAQRIQQSPNTREGERGNENNNGKVPNQRKSFGDLFVESQAFKGKTGNSGPEATLDIDLKGLMLKTTATDVSTDDGWAPQNIRTGRVVDFVTRPIQVVDIVPQNATNQSAVVFMQETGYGTDGVTNAAEVAEGGAYPQTDFQLTEESSPVRKISVYLAITDEQLEDVAQVRGYVDNRLPFMVRQRLDSQILAGDGSAPNLKGLTTYSGIQTQAKGSDATPDAVYKAMTSVRVTGGAMPNAAVFNPFDWQGIRLLRTADGLYIWGNPSDTGVSRIWGLQVTEAQALTAGTIIVGDFANYSELAVKRGINVQVSNSHADYFVNGKQAMRADMRAAFVVYRPAAFCKITGV
jgi:HK97 family phage major capsid protein